jgi:hypothetical protein
VIVGAITFDNNNGNIEIRNESSAVPRRSVLGRLVEIIAEGNGDDVSLDRLPSEIETKINFNDLKYHVWVVESYLESSILIDESIKQLNQLILNGSTKLKRQMNMFYKTALSSHGVSMRPFDLEKLRANSDSIVKSVMDQTRLFVLKSSDISDGYFAEDIDYGVELIVSYSIIECVVLENENAHA